MPPSLLPFLDLRTRSAWHRLRLLLVAIACVFLALIWGVTLNSIQREKELALQGAGNARNNLAVVIAENLRQLLQRGSSFADAAANWKRLGTAAMGERLATLRAGDPAFRRLALYGRDGRLLYASSPADTAAVARAIRDELAGLAPERLSPLRVVSTADAAARSWLVPLLFPVYSPSGAVDALLEVDLDLGYLLRLFQQLDFGRQGEIRVLAGDGQELARVSRSGLVVHGAEPPPRGRIVSRQAVADYPLQVEVGQQEGDILGRLSISSFRLVPGMLVLSAMAIGLMLWSIHLLWRNRGDFEHLRQSEAEKQRLIEQLEEEKRHAYHLAAHDHLTGLYNRRTFTELAARHLALARRQRQISAVLFLDIDRFKSINDTLGHKSGDLLLQQIADRLRGALDPADLIARFGGDEFVVMLTGLGDENEIEHLAARLTEVLSHPYAINGHTIQSSPSIGIVVYPRDGSDIDALLLHADSAMYQAKTRGRGMYVFYDPSIKNNSTLKFQLEQHLPAALDNQEFVLHFQPKVDLHSFAVAGYEALVRWQHPQLGLIFPNDFIAMAEESGHIQALGAWVIEAACAQLAAWRDEGLPLLPVAVNLSGRQLQDPDLPDKIAGTLDLYGIPAALLEIEVTESSLIENLKLADELLTSLHSAGVRIALDDFGTGFSSLGYIKALPISTIKVDRAFIRDINNSQDDAVIVSSLIALAHNLDIKVVAEGVETRDQLIYLKTADCDQAQGYLFSRPVPAGQVPALFKQSIDKVLA